MDAHTALSDRFEDGDVFWEVLNFIRFDWSGRFTISTFKFFDLLGKSCLKTRCANIMTTSGNYSSRVKGRKWLMTIHTIFTLIHDNNTVNII